MKLNRDVFLVQYDASKVKESAILISCLEAGFEATIAKETSRAATDSETGIKGEFSHPDFYLRALEAAERENKPIVLDFMATWCGPCKRMSDETFVEPNVAALLEQCVVLKIDTDQYPGLAKIFRVYSLPDIRFLTARGEQIRKLHGFQESESFSKELKTLLKQMP